MIRTLVLFLAAGIGAQAATLTVSPASVSGPPGSTVQLGFTITNTVDYLLVTGSGYCLAPASLPVCTASSLGTYTDVIGTNFIVVGPSPEQTSVTEPGGAATGLGHFTFFGNASGAESGLFYISYETYSRSPNDPNFDSITDTVLVGQFLTTLADVRVDTAIPEPASLSLTAMALAGIAILRRR